MHDVQVYRVLTSNSIESAVYNTALQKDTQSRLMLDDHDDESAEEQQARVRDVSMAESLFGKDFHVKSHDDTIRNLEIHFRADREQSAKRFEQKKLAAAERARKQGKAKRKLPKLVKMIRRWLTKKDGVTTGELITKFQPVCAKHSFSKDMLREALRKAGRCTDGVWTALAL